jgi:hypothetical protein
VENVQLTGRVGEDRSARGVRGFNLVEVEEVVRGDGIIIIDPTPIDVEIVEITILKRYYTLDHLLPSHMGGKEV